MASGLGRIDTDCGGFFTTARTVPTNFGHCRAWLSFAVWDSTRSLVAEYLAQQLLDQVHFEFLKLI